MININNVEELKEFYLKNLKEKFNGNLRISLRAYNAGPSGYKKAKNDWYYEKIKKQMSAIPN